MTIPNVAPSGVIQNPGIGEILGGGLGQLAQFLQARQQAEQQRQLAMQQLGQGQQRIDLEKQGQQFAEQQAAAAAAKQAADLAESQRQQGVIGQALAALSSGGKPVLQSGIGAGQLGTAPDYSSLMPSVTTPPPGLGDLGLSGGDLAALTATPGYKSIVDQQQKDAEAKRLSSEVMDINGQPVQKYGGQPVGAPITKPLEASDIPADVRSQLFLLGLPVNTPSSALSPAQRDQIRAGITALAQAKTPGTDLGVELQKAAVPEYIKQGSTLAQASMKAKDDNINIKNALGALDRGAFTGPGANVQTGLYSMMSKLGFGDAEKATNTQELLQATASRIIPLPTGISRLTNQELQFLQLVKANKVTLNEATIRQVLQLAKKANDGVIFDNNKKLVQSKIPQFLQDMYRVDPASDDDYRNAFGKVKPSEIGGGP